MLRRLLLLFALCSVLGVLPAAAQGYDPVFTPGDCPFIPASGDTVECGTVITHEDRSQPYGRTVELAVAIFRARTDTPAPDPVVYLDGGPGGSTLENWGPSVGRVFDPLLSKRDVVVFDYRGAGFSTPSLSCPETVTYTLATLDDNLSDADAVEGYYAALDACRVRLENEGVDFDLYDSRALAGDVIAVADALGYDSVNLLGISYGTRLALTLLRDHPDRVRSAIIDGVLPLQVDRSSTFIGHAERALGALFDACAADPACDAAYPNLRQLTFETARRLDAEPMTMTFVLPENRESYEVVMNGSGFIAGLYQALYASWAIPLLPRAIAEVHAGESRVSAYLGGVFLEGSLDFSVGLYTAQECNEEYPFARLDDLRAAAAAFPDMAEFWLSDELVGERAVLENCIHWNTSAPDPAENAPVSSETPVLVLNGGFDPVTPPAWGDLAAETLANSVVLTFPTLGHGASTSDACAMRIAGAFLDDPSTPPDARCIQRLDLTFDVPVTSVTLVPFNLPESGLSGVRPEGWRETAPGAFASSFFNDTAIFYYLYPDDGGAFVDSLSDFYGAEPAAVDTVTAGGRDWEVRVIPAAQYVAGVGVATTTLDDGNLLMVMVTAASDAEFDLLYDSLFLPALRVVGYRDSNLDDLISDLIETLPFPMQSTR